MVLVGITGTEIIGMGTIGTEMDTTEIIGDILITTITERDRRMPVEEVLPTLILEQGLMLEIQEVILEHKTIPLVEEL